MNTPVLQLETYFFTEVSCKANPKFDISSAETFPVNIDVSTRVKVARSSEQSSEFQIELIIENKDWDEKSNEPYEINLTVVGFINLDDDVDEERKADIALVNGASILYSSAREYLLSVTSRGPWPPVQLMTKSFRGLIGKLRDEAVKDKKSDKAVKKKN